MIVPDVVQRPVDQGVLPFGQFVEFAEGSPYEIPVQRMPYLIDSGLRQGTADVLGSEGKDGVPPEIDVLCAGKDVVVAVEGHGDGGCGDIHYEHLRREDRKVRVTPIAQIVLGLDPETVGALT